ncbi:MAG: GNAT family N-acetyltransferase [Bacteroidales bacterium]|nr:GNAT family N-acetyltransferase [Bacteroidales bacterium]
MRAFPIEIIPCNFENRVHCEALVRLMNEYITDKMGGGQPYTEEQKVKLVEGLKNHPCCLVYLASSGNEFVGLVNSFVNFATFTVKPFINIHDVIVTEAWRNNGVGRSMLLHVIEKAKDLGCSKVTLEVRADNQNARYLYDSLGFKDAEPRQYYWAKYL